MNFSKTISAILLYLLSCIFTRGENTRAFIVAVGNYPENSGWEFIHTANDARLITQVLQKTGTPKEHIHILSDQYATYKQICSALQQLCLQTCRGDFIYLHFSGHGQQMADDNGDEVDGLDEAFIPYDASFWYLPSLYEGENHLRDDELGKWIYELRKKAGSTGCVWVVIDACHSGTGHRNPPQGCYLRGTTKLFAPEGYIPQKGKHPELDRPLTSHPQWAPVVVLSACQSDEVNMEFYDEKTQCFYGRLTYCIAEIISHHRKPILPQKLYRLLQEKMRQLPSRGYHHSQTPYIEYSNSTQPLPIP